MSNIAVTENGDSTLFNFPDGMPCPCVGDILYYSFEAGPEAQAEFNDDALKHEKGISRHSWTVTKVEHHIRRYVWNQDSGTTWVHVKRNKK